ncbi:deoxyribonuclease IV [Desulfothermus naphthae]
MPYLGAHMSISGGIHKAIDRIKKVNGTALQIFSKNQRQWKARPLDGNTIEIFKHKWREWGSYEIAIHTSYLINLAAKNKEIRKKSIYGLIDELNRASQLGIKYVVAHPGSHGGDGTDPGLKRVVNSIESAIEESGPDNVLILLETTSGQGNSLGSRFEEFAYIIKKCKYSDRLGVCIDTAHIFQAGYDIRDEMSYKRTIELIDKLIGLDKIRFFHLNDSKTELGSKVDRHEHIGQGKIGLSGFRNLLNDPLFKNHSMVLETPKGKDLKEDKRNLKVLNSLINY